MNINKIKKDNKDWWDVNKENERLKRRNHYSKHKANIAANQRKKYKKDPLKYKNYDLKKIYGISLDDYNKILKDQNNCCAICKKHKDAFTKSLAVDHCHLSGKVRGLLCINCNRAIGNLKDSIENARNLMTYLESD